MQAQHTLSLPARPVAASLARRITRPVLGLLAAWRRQRLHQARLDALNALDDRTLRDLGLHRGEIGSIAAELSGKAEPSYVRAQLVQHLRT